MLEIMTQLAAILIISFFLKELADRIRIPFIVILILGGTLAATYGIVQIKTLGTLPDMIRTVALILVVFSSAFYFNVEQMKKYSKTIFLMVTIGVILTAALVSTTMLYLLPISVVTAIFIGVLLSGTDTAAVTMGLPKKESKMIEIMKAESIFNDPMQVMLPLLLIDFIEIPEAALLNIPKLVILIAMGIGVGCAAGIIGRKFVQNSGGHAETVALGIAIGTFVIAENVLGSGILAVAVSGILMNRGYYKEKNFLGEFNSELAFISTLFVFFMLGAQFTIPELNISPFEIFAIGFAVRFARLVTILVVMFHSELNLIERLKVGLIAPKGVAPAALAPLVLSPQLALAGASVIVMMTY